MNNKARRITFCVTCVVVKIVVTHFKKPMDGNASGANGFTFPTVKDGCSSARCKVAADSNQKRQVTLTVLARFGSFWDEEPYLCGKLSQTALTIIYRRWNLQVRSYCRV